jgi:preprotein translocase subunit YajC
VDIRLLALMAPSEGQSGWTGLIPLAMMLGVFYFLLIAPMRRRQKQQKEMIGALQTGDRVVTSGGIYGTIVGIKEERLTLRIADQVKIEVSKASVSGLDQPPKE